MGCCSDKGSWTQDPISGLNNWSDSSGRVLVNSPAVMQHGNGVDVQDLASFIQNVATMAASRVQGVGAKEYGGQIQQFETKSVADLRQDILEEVADVVAYAAMIAIKTLALNTGDAK